MGDTFTCPACGETLRVEVVEEKTEKRRGCCPWFWRWLYPYPLPGEDDDGEEE